MLFGLWNVSSEHQQWTECLLADRQGQFIVRIKVPAAVDMPSPIGKLL